MLVWFFFFKQKTAYEMRISDWSSDVCSSDLQGPGPKQPLIVVCGEQVAMKLLAVFDIVAHAACACHCFGQYTAGDMIGGEQRPFPFVVSFGNRRPEERPVEHPSELHSQMRISYAALCLKKQQ